ncbi:MAG: type II secretion system protein [Xenococcaceae cyanobacterium MO_188.B29]|nr:type II secretion system protein [Xenococcaceae cyanobacterium MO_188.B29]
MLKIKKIYAKKSKSDEGFTLLEVLVAMLIATFFVVGSMQALVLATALRVKAQEKQRANQLIQEDIEQIQFEAEDLAIDHSLCSATSYDPDSNPANPDSYAQELWDELPLVPSDKQLLDSQGKTYRLSRTLATDSSGVVISTAKVLKINFSVSPLDKNGNIETDKNGNIIVITTDYTEVIPNAAIQCP